MNQNLGTKHSLLSGGTGIHQKHVIAQVLHGSAHCWEQTGLLKAWSRPVQLEASGKVKELFPNLADVPAVDLTVGGDSGARDLGSEDPEAGELGKAFTQRMGFGKGDPDGDEEEWAEWIDWAALGGSSADAD